MNGNVNDSNELFENLLKLDEMHQDKDSGKTEPNSAIKQYSLSSYTGQRLYNSLSDEQLLNALVRIAQRIGHSPSQKEIIWVLRDFIKVRFGKWPYALKRAGLSKSAGSGGTSIEQMKLEKHQYEQMLEHVRQKAAELGKLPHPKDLPEIVSGMKKHFQAWHQVLEAAGVDRSFFQRNLQKIDNLEPEYVMLLKKLEQQAFELNRPPLYSEAAEDIRHTLVPRCGSWRGTLFQLGLDPPMRVTPFPNTYLNYCSSASPKHRHIELHDCCYKLIYRGPELQKDLESVNSAAQRLGRSPKKTDVPKDVRIRLTQACLSWKNVLFQLDM